MASLWSLQLKTLIGWGGSVPVLFFLMYIQAFFLSETETEGPGDLQEPLPFS